jgi:hypothetical protein
MDEPFSRRLRIWLVATVIVGAPAFFALPYLLPEPISRFDRGLAFAGLFVVTTGLAHLVAWLLTRRASD